MSEIYALLSQPAVALPDVTASEAGERWDPSAFLSVMSRWPEAQRFPRKFPYLSRLRV
jgi:phospholipase A-2-activating protein